VEELLEKGFVPFVGESMNLTLFAIPALTDGSLISGVNFNLIPVSACRGGSPGGGREKPACLSAGRSTAGKQQCMDGKPLPATDGSLPPSVPPRPIWAC
jgi:hypothetical protein